MLYLLNEIYTCLFAAYTGRGKTKIATEAAARLVVGGGLVLVTTPVSDTKQGFENDIVQHHFGEDRNRKITYMDGCEFKSTTIQDIVKRTENGELIFLVITVQDLRYDDFKNTVDLDEKSNTVMLREIYQQLDGKVDLWIRDERHLQYTGQKTSAKLDLLTAPMCIDLTATPYNCAYTYKNEQIVNRDIIWGLMHRKFTNIPEMSIDAINASISKICPKIAPLFTVDEGYDPRKLFVRENGEFVHYQEIITIMEKMYTDTLSRKKNPLSISNDLGLSDVSKRCGMIVLPSGNFGDSATDYIPALAKLLNKTVGKVFWIDSYTLDRVRQQHSIEEYVENLLMEHQKVILLTCGKYTTGTNIPALGHVVLLDKIGSLSQFVQLIGRPIRVYNEKTKVKIYSIAPGAELKITLGRIQLESEGMSGVTSSSLLDCVPLSEYDGLSWKTFDPSDIINSAQDWYSTVSKRGLSNQLIQHALIDYDLSGFKGKNLSTLIPSSPKISLSDENGSKVKIMENGSSSFTNKDVNHALLQKIIDTIQCITNEMLSIAYMDDNYVFMNILNHPLINGGMFEKDLIGEVIKLLDDRKILADNLQKYLDEKKYAFKNLSFREVYDQVFVNNKHKQKIGFVYIPLKLGEELIEQTTKKL
jgi:hypothetical protein